MCRQSSCGPSSVEQAIAAEESLLVYCKPVELYNILYHRARRHVKPLDLLTWIIPASFVGLMCVIYYLSIVKLVL